LEGGETSKVQGEVWLKVEEWGRRNVKRFAIRWFSKNVGGSLKSFDWNRGKFWWWRRGRGKHGGARKVAKAQEEEWKHKTTERKRNLEAFTGI
jgi:hypothetical protein